MSAGPDAIFKFRGLTPRRISARSLHSSSGAHFFDSPIAGCLPPRPPPPDQRIRQRNRLFQSRPLRINQRRTIVAMAEREKGRSRGGGGGRLQRERKLEKQKWRHEGKPFVSGQADRYDAELSGDRISHFD